MKDRWQSIRSWQQLRDYIRSDGSGLPAHLRQMLKEAEEKTLQAKTLQMIHEIRNS